MRLRARVVVGSLLLVVVGAFIFVNRSARAQEGAGARTRLPSNLVIVDNLMDLLGKGKIDDALAAIDVYKDQPDAKEAMRGKLIHLNTVEHHYYGYDIVGVQRFSSRLQSVSVLAYYDLHPMLFHLDLYHPEDGGGEPWIVLGFNMHEDVVEHLQDVPVDYRTVVR